MGILEEKRALRRLIRGRLLAMDPAERARQQAALEAAFPRLPGLEGARSVLLYVTAFPEEIDTRPMLDGVLASGQALACPRVDASARRLVLHRVREPARDLLTTANGLIEPGPDCPVLDPSAIDWILVPGLAFDVGCRRLGRGGGYYDRLLPTLRPGVPRWALAFAPQVVEAVPTGAHDAPLDGVAGPDRRYP